MLSKSEIIEGIANEEIIVSNAVYEYVCNLHLYDDEQHGVRQLCGNGGAPSDRAEGLPRDRLRHNLHICFLFVRNRTQSIFSS